ncbi:MAG: hypothetical protein GY804_08955 [Alphaproteobacteria bacterium]|nr:hypothetical protein [Alphaproteobacteria bacterium]
MNNFEHVLQNPLLKTIVKKYANLTIEIIDQKWGLDHVAAATFSDLQKFEIDWYRQTKDGWSAAHIAAARGVLPHNVDAEVLNIIGPDKTSVAHIWARVDYLPKWFNSWGMKDIEGYPVASVAARNGHIEPSIFEHWYLTDPDGLTVAEIMLENNYKIPKNMMVHSTESMFDKVMRM